MLEHGFVTPARKLDTSRNAFGDFTDTGGGTTYNCRFRETSQLLSTDLEEITTDAMAWFAPDVPVEENSIWEIEGNFYKLIKILNAKRLGETEIQFIKTWFLRHKPVVS